MAEQIKDPTLETEPVSELSDLERHVQQIRNATVFIAWIVGIATAISLILGIILGVQVYKAVNAVNNSNSSSVSCASIGGTDLSC